MVSNSVGALFSDALDACGVVLSNAGGSVAGRLVGEALKRRIETARQIALEEMRRGERFQSYVADADELAAVVLKYLECARQGTARRNLRLMARIIRGQMATRTLYADDFLRYADLLASLSYEEVCFLATAYRVRRKILASESGRPLNELRKLADNEIEARILGRGKVFADKRELEATKAALQRTGLIYLAGTGSSGNVVYDETILLDRIGELAELEEELPEEGEVPGRRCPAA